MAPSNPKHFNRGHRSAINFSAAPQCRVHSFMVLCENHASPAAPQRFRTYDHWGRRSCWRQAGICVERFSAHQRRHGVVGGARADDGTKLSKACPMLKPGKQAA